MNTAAETEREYRVWIKGRRISTEATVFAANKLAAQIRFAGQLGIKSFQTDAVWVRRGEAR